MPVVSNITPPWGHETGAKNVLSQCELPENFVKLKRTVKKEVSDCFK